MNRIFLWTELIFLFVIIPILLFFQIPLFIKLPALFSGIIYVVIVSARMKLFKRSKLFKINFTNSIKSIQWRIILVFLLTGFLMFLIDKEKKFIVVRKNPMMWVSISLVYSIFSVYPQEFIYRFFFFERYSELFKKEHLLIIVNALIFSLGHIMFKSSLVIILTLVGGILFALTFIKTKSLFFTSIEHALYGIWLFTLGMGEILAFPMPE